MPTDLYALAAEDDVQGPLRQFPRDHRDQLLRVRSRREQRINAPHDQWPGTDRPETDHRHVLHRGVEQFVQASVHSGLLDEVPGNRRRGQDEPVQLATDDLFGQAAQHVAMVGRVHPERGYLDDVGADRGQPVGELGERLGVELGHDAPTSHRLGEQVAEQIIGGA